jgi:RNA polymerase sigma-70 factor (ECF subfamily)
MPQGMIAQISNMDNKVSYHISADQISDELVLIKEAQADPKKFELLYRKYFPTLTRFVYQRVIDKSSAYDITANVFYDALRNIGKYKNQGVPFSAWLYRIAINKINETYRKNNSQRTFAVDNEGLSSIKTEVDIDSSAQADEKLFEALDTLEKEEMELIEMRFFEDRPFKEICEITGMGESACKMRVYRILEKLKTELKNIH